MVKLFERCPACGGPLLVSECRCQSCRLQMRGDFLPGPFSSLSADQLAFVRLFLQARGNLTEVEKVLGVSYPTIRNKLDEINQALDAAEAPPVQPAPPSAAGAESQRQRILQRVAAGELSAAQAMRMLRELKGER
jgi:hypothetical protein